MGYIERNLLEGERIVFRTHLHWIFFFGPAFFAIFMLVVAWSMGGTDFKGFWWIPIVLALFSIASAVIRKRSSDFVVTNKRVMMKVGVFSTRSVELLLNKIETIAVDQNLIERLFGAGNIVITGSGGSREMFPRIQSPMEFRRAVQSVADASSANVDTSFRAK